MATILPKSLLLAGAAATLLLNPGFAATVADMQPAGKGKVPAAKTPIQKRAATNV